MLQDANSPQTSDAFASAKKKLTVGDVPNWVVPRSPDYKFSPQSTKTPRPTTLLLWSIQNDLETSSLNVHMAVRLENMLAVQHESQWKIEFEPQNQTVILHWIKTRRGEIETQHTDIQRIHLLQREAGLEGCVIDGYFTALMLIEDVRPGDVLEWCYTIQTSPRLLPDNRFAFHQLPPATPIGSVFFGFIFDKQRPMKWKSSGADFTPVEEHAGEAVIWKWEREKFMSREPDEHIPSWYLAGPWIQVSDCSNWSAVAQAVAGAWGQNSFDASVAQLVENITTSEPEILGQIEKALRLVQDEFRYLSVNLEYGGQIPTEPDKVARRRFGDCKDLSFLLVHILRRLGLTAFPVLVNGARRRDIANALPSPGMFDHVVVQFETGGEVRWVDATIKNQGGGPLKRVLPHFGFGLVISRDTVALTKPPSASVRPGYFKIRESVLLDTTGANSSVAIVTTAEGSEAETLRRHFSSIPIEQIARDRLQNCAARYQNARRIGDLKFRDDRDVNEFHLSEVFEVNGFLSHSQEYGCCDFFTPLSVIGEALRLPEKSSRKDPFALPPPCNLTHIYEIQSGGVQNTNSPRTRAESALLKFNSQVRAMPGSWSVILNLTILDDVVMPEQFDEHYRRAGDIWHDCLWRLTVPVGYPSAGRNRAFGTLPSPPRPPTSKAAQLRPSVPPTNRTDMVLAENSRHASGSPILGEARKVVPNDSNSTQHKQKRSKRYRADSSSMKTVWVIVSLAIVLFIVLIALIASLAKDSQVLE